MAYAHPQLWQPPPPAPVQVPLFQVPQPAPLVAAPGPSPSGFVPTSVEVEVDADYQRIAALPRRSWEQNPELPRRIAYLTSVLKTPRGAQTLRPAQAAALWELYEVGGLFAPMRVGSGKTLITLLAATLLQARSPLIVVPASLREKTYADAREYAKDWRIAPFNLLTYEEIQQKKGGVRLINLAPDLWMFDEVQYIKDRKAKRTRKIRKAIDFWRHRQRIIVGGLSGSIAGRAFGEFWHVIKWCLGTGTPLPLELRSFLGWSYALDEKISDFARLDPGPLCELSPGAYEDALARKARRGQHAQPTCLEVARSAWGLRFVSCPGVISTGEDVPSNGLIIELERVPAPQPVAAAITELRRDWATPDGQEFEFAFQIWAKERELARGGWWRWDPLPPLSWILPRRAVAKFIRETTGPTRARFDSRAEVEAAIDSGALKDGGLLAAWRAVEPTFEPNSVWSWLAAGSHVLIERAVAWLRANPQRGIVWVQNTAVGNAVATLAAVPYYHEEACDAHGRHIRDARSSCVASIKSCGAGQNLQWFSHNYLLEAPTKGDVFEQLLGRTHRDGQEADDVHVLIPLMTVGDAKGLEQAIKDSERAENTEQQPKKLCYATWIGFSLKEQNSLL